MEYRNKKTGFSFFSECKISGEDWELVETKEKLNKAAQQGTTPVVLVQNISEPVTEPEPTVASEPDPNEPTGNADIDSLSKKDIIQELEAMGIDHNPRDKKQVLYDLMMGK
ncbi:hypothetical protein [Enterococcus asini]|uniref:hypothetical protein n=1 Tax=Enterococcus asini TaxID=57732 RepID=UPI0022E9669A|nr:hypothetical protein [Enterococcus asini]